MGYAKVALTVLRLGIGLYLLFTAVTRLMGLGSVSTFNSIYGWMGGGVPVGQTTFSTGASIFLGLLGLALLSRRLLVVSGVLVAIVGIVSGVSEIITSQTLMLVPADRFTRLSNGVRDVLVLASTGVAIAALDSYVRHRTYRDTRDARARGVTMYREERTPVGSATVDRTTSIDTDEPPTRPYV